MQLNLKPPAVTVEPNQVGVGSVRPISGLMSLALGGILTIGAIAPGSVHVGSDFSVLTVNSWNPVAEPPPTGLQFPTGKPEAADIPLKSESREQNPPAGEKLAREVRLPVKDFLKRVVVPILVQRYIASLNPGNQFDRTLGAA